MSKHDPLSLYHAIMGEVWEEENRRAGAARERAASRQMRSYKRSGRPLVRDVVKASQGSRSAVFKRIRAGGCKTKRSLGNQLNYVNDKAVYCFSSMVNGLSDSANLTTDQKERIIDQWSGTWRGSSKLGFTSHMLLSFPTDVTTDQVKGIALDWCEHFFESGHYGDEWDYVVAIHTDRAHPHAHILLNNRGKDQGVWFSCWAEGVMSPQLMREKQAEIAENYGVALDATTRLERGIFEKAAGLEEIYAAKSEGRTARELMMTEDEASMAQAAVIAFAKEYRDAADILDRSDKSHLAAGVRRMAKALANGTAWNLTEGEVDLDEIRTVGDAIEYAETRIEEIRDHAGTLGQPDRTMFELRATPVIASLSQLVPDPSLRTAYNQEMANPYPPGSNAEDLAGVFGGTERSEALDEVLHDGNALGLNMDETLAQLEAGGTTNHGLAQDWLERDLTAILAKDGIEIEAASVEEIDAAVEKLDEFQMRFAAELGVEKTSAFDVLEPGQLDHDHQQEVALAESDEPANTYIRHLAQELRVGDLSAEQEELMQRTLVAELHKELGDEGLAELDRGHWEVLEAVLPSKVDQISVTTEYLEISAETRGEPELTEIALDLQQTRAVERAREISNEQHKDRGLDDELGL